jgi:hypothetical protein
MLARTGGYTAEFGCSRLSQPEGLALSTNELELYVVSRGNHGLCVFATASGEFLRVLSVREPRAVVVLSSGDIAVSRGTGTDRGLVPNVDVFAASGRLIKSIELWKLLPIVDTGFAVDRDNNLYVEAQYGQGVLIVSAYAAEELVGYIEHDPSKGWHPCLAVCPDGAIARVKGSEVHLFRSGVTDD